MSKPRLAMLKPRVTAAKTTTIKNVTTETQRKVTGRMLARRRFKLWSKSPHCAMCKRLVDYPRGFELDHEVPLWKGGSDAEANCQILCVYYGTDGKKQGCHAIKTALEAKEMAWR